MPTTLIGQPAELWITAIRHAYTMARARRTTMTIVADRQHGYRVVQSPAPDDVVLVCDIRPPRWNDDLERAKIEAFMEFKDAQPALERMVSIIRDATGGAGSDRSELTAEIAEEVMRQFIDLCLPTDLILPSNPPAKRGFFTRLFFGAD